MQRDGYFIFDCPALRIVLFALSASATIELADTLTRITQRRLHVIERHCRQLRVIHVTQPRQR